MIVNFNPKNSFQVTHHLASLIKTDMQLSHILRMLIKKRSEAIGRFDSLIKFDGNQIIVPYFEQYAEVKTDCFGLELPLDKQIAFAMRDFDAPFSKSEVIKFCSFFEIEKNEMLKCAIDDEKFFEWARNETLGFID